MTTFVRSLFKGATALALALGLAACGGGGNGLVVGTSPTTTATSTVTVIVTPTLPTVIVPFVGIAFPLAANYSVHVPAGTQITAPNGPTTTLGSATTSINVPANSLITVPTTVAGTATILVTTNIALASGILTTLPTAQFMAGSPSVTGPPVDGTGTSAVFWGGGHLAVNSAGTVMVSDGGALRQVTQAGAVTTLVTGYLPYDWEGLAVDIAGTVYGSGTSYAPPPDAYGASIQTRTLAGTLATVVSNWTTSPTVSALGYGGLAVNSSGAMFLTDAANHRILKFTPAGAVSVFAGNGKAGLTDGTGIIASFNKPSDLSMDGAGNLYVSDTGNSAIRKITPAGVVTTFGKLATPGAITADTAGNVFVAAGTPRGLYRISSDMTAIVSYPLTGVTDPITGLTVDSQGRVYVGTFGVGAQIFKVAF